MNKFVGNYDNVMFSGEYDEVSEPLKEYTVDDEDYIHETSTSCTLLGVKSKKTGHWGWINTSGTFIISAEYDSGWIRCYNGIVILQRNGKYGGLYRTDLKIAFKFEYEYIGVCFKDVYCVRKNGRIALSRPCETRVTDFNYHGITREHDGPVFGFVKDDLYGKKSGKINVLTGEEQ